MAQVLIELSIGAALGAAYVVWLWHCAKRLSNAAVVEPPDSPAFLAFCRSQQSSSPVVTAPGSRESQL